MALRLDQAVGPPAWYDNWPRPGRPPFMRSEAYWVLLTEMRRYVQEEVAGRAFLISGHRGAGKTTLVQRVIDDLGDELFGTWMKNSDPGNAFAVPSLVRRPQRPLLVKLHGPSLLTTELPQPGGGEAAKPATPAAPPTSAATPASATITVTAGTVTAGTVTTGTARADPRTPEPAAAPAKSVNTAHGALVQITIALYRALAREFSEAYAIHARAAHRAERDDQLEMAAQFRLDLDRAPETGLLRGAWERLAYETGATRMDPMSAGIIWPREIGAFLSTVELPDQGAREIVALATAAQAYQVCSGAITYTQNRKDDTSYERTSESKAGIDTKDAINRIVGLTIGGLLGLGAANLAGVSAAAGVGAGLLGSLAVTASVKRSARTERQEDYTFIVDRSIQTLERDLPMVIERVREAGLAPVFLIDELDKLEKLEQPANTGDRPAPAEPDAAAATASPSGANPADPGAAAAAAATPSGANPANPGAAAAAPSGGAPAAASAPPANPPTADPATPPAEPAANPGPANGTSKTVTDLIRNLKHLTTDFGFFCFLTGPDYFEEVQQKIDAEAFPEEHTYFSDRLFVLYTPTELKEFLRSVIRSDAAPGTPDHITDQTARDVLAAIIVHRSQLNTIDAVRALAHGWTPAGTYTIPSGTLTSQPRYRLAVGTQLAIEHVLRGPTVAARIARDPHLRQMTVDTLYMISREWEQDRTSVDLSDRGLANYLLGRRAGKPKATGARRDPVKVLTDEVGDSNFKELTSALALLAVLLCDFAVLLDGMARENADANDRILAELARGTEPLALLYSPARGRTFCFRFDYDGNPLSEPSPAVGRGPMPRPPPRRAAAPPTRELTVEMSDSDKAQLTTLTKFTQSVVDLMHEYRLTLSDLADVELLPPGVSQSEMLRVAARLDAAVAASRPYDGLPSDRGVLQGLADMFRLRGTAIGWAIEVAIDVVHDAGLSPTTSLAATIRAMARYLDFASLATVTERARLDDRLTGHWRHDPSPPPPIGSDTESLAAWRAALYQFKLRPRTPDLDALEAQSWDRWEARIAAPPGTATVPDSPVFYDDLVLAAAGRMPARIMRTQQASMNPLDWSELALAGSLADPTRPVRPHWWALLAGLRRQGFRAVEVALSGFHGDVVEATPSDTGWSLVTARLQQLADDDKGVLVILAGDGANLEYDRLVELNGVGPYLFLRETRVEEYTPGVQWLHGLGIFRLVIDER